jgi:hypothetical protein
VARALLLLVGAAASVVPTAVGATNSTKDPRLLVLRPTDVPAGFRRYDGRYIPNALARRSFGYTVGRVNGYAVTFVNGKVAKAIANVTSIADVYRDSRHAHAAFLALTRSEARVRARPLVLGAPIGYEARLYTQRLGDYVVYTLGWRYRAVRGTLALATRDGAMKASAVVALARKQQAHMRAAG